MTNILIIGAGELGMKFYESVRSSTRDQFKIVGFLDDQPRDYLNGQYLGQIDKLDEVLRIKPINEVVIALPHCESEKLIQIVTICEHHTTRVKIIPEYYQILPKKFTVTFHDRIPVIPIHNDIIERPFWRFIKRSFDLTITLLAFVLIFSWLFPLIGLFIKLCSRGPVFFIQERWGKNNELIRCLKFRSMTCDAKTVDQDGKYLQAIENDPRVTKFGAFIRKTSLDELPQFWNVLKGEMSIVGPRPHPVPLNLESKDKIHKYMQRTLVKPGITGWAQIHGYRGETRDPVMMQKRVEYDLWYIENWSILLDIIIVLKTFWYLRNRDQKAY